MAVTPHPPPADAGIAADPRLAPVLTDDGEIDRVTVQRLLDTAPSELTTEQLEAMQVIVLDDQLAAGLEPSNSWMRALIAVTYKPITATDTVVVTDSASPATVTRFAARSHRRAQVKSHGRRVRPRSREHRAIGRRRSGASSTSSGADPGDGSSDDGPSHPPPELHLWRHSRWGACSPSLLRVLVGEQVGR